MRSNLYCVTTWGAVLGVNRYDKFKPDTGLAWVFDPQAVDAGQFISMAEIVLIIRIKAFKNDLNKFTQ